MLIRGFRESDAAKVSKMIIRTAKITNSKDYSEEWLNALEKKNATIGYIRACRLDAFLCC